MSQAGPGAVGFECEGNEAGETAGLVLQLTEPPQMLNPMSIRFDMPEKHRRSAAHTHVVPQPMHLEPFISALLATADLLAHFRVEDLRAATRDRTESRPSQ